MRDRELLQLLHDSPCEGLRALMELHMGLVCAVIRGRLAGIGTEEDIEDCASDAFASFYRSLDQIDLNKGTLKSYLCAIARHKAADRALERTREPLSVEIGNTEALADGFSLEEAYLTEERRQALVDAIAALGEPDHEIIVRKFYFNEPSKSIAKRLGTTVSVVDTRTHRALQKLKKRLEAAL